MTIDSQIIKVIVIIIKVKLKLTNFHAHTCRRLLVELTEYSSATIDHRAEYDDLSTTPQVSK